MRVISPKRVREFYRKHANARKPMEDWLKKAKKADWNSLVDVRRYCPGADAVPMKSGRTATIINVGGNSFRLALEIRYKFKVVYVRRVMTHAEYDTNAWHADFS